MGFSMNMNKFLIFATCSAALAGCGGGYKPMSYSSTAVTTPTDIQETYLSSTSLYGSDEAGRSADIAVLLPMSGSSKTIGNNIKTSIEAAFLRKPKSNIKLSFYDVSGSEAQHIAAINEALSDKPDIIIGPLFANDAKLVRKLKPSKTPAISFTSDITALGDGLITTNLLPTQSAETIIRQMQMDGAKDMIILAPDDDYGKLMVDTAYDAAAYYDVSINGIFYYTPRNSDSIKDATMRASMYNTRAAANTRAREVLSDILTKESLSAADRKSLKNQLEKISRTETLGKLPYDSILFLGNGEDTKTIASFLRYYGVGNRDAAFYGTTLWQGSDITSDFTMSGAKYATLPEISPNFTSLYNMVAGEEPDHLAAFGYDAANLALGMLYAQKSDFEYIYDANGYVGTSGVFRILPSGESERALRIMALDGSGEPVAARAAPTNFLVPLYNIHNKSISKISARELSTRGINPGDYITIPDNLRRKSEYRTKTIGANYVEKNDENVQTDEPIQIFAPADEPVSNPEFESVKKETVSRKYIDSVEISE